MQCDFVLLIWGYFSPKKMGRFFCAGGNTYYGLVWDRSASSKAAPLHQIHFGVVLYGSCSSFKENVWLLSNSSFTNGKFGRKDLFDWMRGEKRRGIHLRVAVVGNFAPTPASIILWSTS
uniref:Uncharacterized protein n=1 Tax=Hordeum vulgare subsp. vulgare TaxID=112509 RepID=A0A8I6XZ76_HORVV